MITSMNIEENNAAQTSISCLKGREHFPCSNPHIIHAHTASSNVEPIALAKKPVVLQNTDNESGEADEKNKLHQLALLLLGLLFTNGNRQTMVALHSLCAVGTTAHCVLVGGL